jgi:heme A synthase
MASWTERAFDTVSEITKQVLTLATGIIALTITFSKDFATHAAKGRHLLEWSWVMYVVSIVFGFATLMASAGLQQEGDKPPVPPHDRQTDSDHQQWQFAGDRRPAAVFLSHRHNPDRHSRRQSPMSTWSQT